jgi:hypothetical protein
VSDPLDPETGKLIAEALDRLTDIEVFSCPHGWDYLGICRDGCVEAILTDLCREVRKGAEKAGPGERITAAAIREGRNVYTGPHHATIIHYIAKCAGITPVRGEQGFVTNTGRFVSRKEALGIAVAAGQVTADPLFGSPAGLMSEDLWIVPVAEREVSDLRERLATAERLAKALRLQGHLGTHPHDVCFACAALSSWDGPEIKEG